jgi:hypothetical protein
MRVVQQAEGGPDDAALQLGISWFAQRGTHGKRHEQRARRQHLSRHLAQKREANGGNAALLNDARDQSHGLITDGSGGNQQNGIHAILSELLGHRRRGLLYQPCRSSDGAHKTEVALA